MTISVVVPAYNSTAYIERCLNSIVNQTTLPFEVIVVDDGSSDNTFEKAKAHPLGALTNLRVLRKKNGGISSARNFGITVASSKYVALLDSDDEFLPSHIASLSDAALQHPEAILLFSAIQRVFDTPELAACEAYLPDFRMIARSYCDATATGRIKEMSCSLLESLIKGNFINPSACMFPRVLNGGIVHFNESLKVAEDRALFISLAARGKLIFVDEVTCNIYRTGNNISNSKNGLLHAQETIKALQSIIDENIFSQNSTYETMVFNEIHSRLDNLVYWASRDGIMATWSAIKISRQLGKMFYPHIYAKRLGFAVFSSTRKFQR